MKRNVFQDHMWGGGVEGGRGGGGGRGRRGGGESFERGDGGGGCRRGKLGRKICNVISHKLGKTQITK